MNARTGGISYGIEVFDDAQDTDAFRAMFAVRGKALYPEMDFMFSMIREVLTTSKLTDTKRLYEIIARVRSRASQPCKCRPFHSSSPWRFLRISDGGIPG